MTKRELATVLAALRHYQIGLRLNGGRPPQDVSDIAMDGGLDPLDEEEIDSLCEELNTGEG
jgi:hypothetical protein